MAETKPRREVAAMYRGPGPVYKLNPTLGYNDHCQSKKRQPAYSFGIKNYHDTTNVSPGPKYALATGITRYGTDPGCQASMTGRPKDFTSDQTPSADKYSVDQATRQVYRNAPAYSLAGRTAQSKSDPTPAPNVYSLPPCLGDKTVDVKRNPAYSLRSRSNQGGFSEDLQRTPGPGTYTVTDPRKYKQRGPEYTMTGRNVLPGDSTVKPGPGAHSPEKVYMNRKSAPQVSFGIRHSEFVAPLIVECAD